MGRLRQTFTAPLRKPGLQDLPFLGKVLPVPSLEDEHLRPLECTRETALLEKESLRMYKLSDRRQLPTANITSLGLKIFIFPRKMRCSF